MKKKKKKKKKQKNKKKTKKTKTKNNIFNFISIIKLYYVINSIVQLN